MTETITAREIADVLQKSMRSVQRAAALEGWKHKNDGRERNYFIRALPPEIQERIFRRRNGIDETTVGEMVKRLEIKVPPGKLANPAVATKIRMVCECLAVPQNARGRDARIGEIAESYGYAKGSAYRLMRKVREGKPLERGSRNHGIEIPELGITLRAWDEEAGRMALRALAENKRNHVEKLSLFKRIEQEARNKGLKTGSYRSFCDLAQKMDAAVMMYRDKGVRGLREDIVPPIRRDHTAYRAMECLVGDQHKADYYCFDHGGDVATLELFCWLDFRTQLVWGSIAYKHYNRYTVGQALINAVRWGLPSCVYTDWGKPEESSYIRLLIEQLTGLGVQAESIRHTRAKVRHPQAKPIEGWFGWLDRNLRNAQIPGYCKRLRDSRESELQEKELEELIRAGGLLGIEETVERVFAVIEQWNSHAFKNRGVDNGKSPLQIYNEEVAIHPVSTLSEDVLDYIFLPVVDQTANGKPLTVKRSQVKIKHPIYKRVLTYYHPEFSNHGGEAVGVRYDPFDPSCVWVFRDRELICCAEEWGMVNPKNRDQVAARIEAQNRLVKQIREKYEGLLPEKKRKSHVPRIHPQEREARQLKEAQRLRVTRTPLDEQVDLETGEIVEVSGRGYRPLQFERKTGPVRLRPLFEVGWDKPREED